MTAALSANERAIKSDVSTSLSYPKKLYAGRLVAKPTDSFGASAAETV
jgi:hypothetical protein